MSDALNYLVAARPDAIGPYFKFLKEAGKNLDTRTRDLISVITKVDAQTEGGFRQYLSRALHNGASPNEVIDALLMAFPTLVHSSTQISRGCVFPNTRELLNKPNRGTRLR